MKGYDFNRIIPRCGTNSYKWDTSEEEVLPMWVADMDFPTAPAVILAVAQRAAHGIYGYTKVPEAYYKAIVNWFAGRHGWRIRPEWLIYTTGVVPAISAIIQALCEPGDKVIVQTPAYNCFFSSIRNSRCELSANRLLYGEGRYMVDFDDLEAKAADPKAKLLLLCNPHNPSGRVWTPAELRRIGEICLKHDILVVSDEIHCELTYEGHDYTPFATLSEELEQHSVTCVSPSKAFNLAGLQIANIVAADEGIRRRIDRAININEVCDVNPFGVEALIAAYNEGGEWLNALRRYLWENFCYLQAFFQAHLPKLKVIPLEGTYLAWVDCHALEMSSERIVQRLLDEGRLMVNPGTLYGPGGEGFIRLNFACPRVMLAEGLKRLGGILNP